jgi:tetratricopeptide (TPR) repeat protein
MYQRALKGKERAEEPELPSALNTAYSLGILCDRQGKLKEAKEMYQRALKGKERGHVDRSSRRRLTQSTI